ncbi:MAG: starch-binding protein [Ruminococcus sp.]
MWHLFKKSCVLTNRILPVMLMLTVLSASVVSLFSVNMVSAAETDSSVSKAVDESAVSTADNENVYNAVNEFPSNIAGVKATYYDYLSDEEINNGWLNPIQAGTGKNGSSDNWYPFYIFNEEINKKIGSTSSYPLYFGNFCNTSDAYTEGNHGGPYSNATGSLGNFHYTPNNSNALTNYNQSVQGLAAQSLDSNGNIKTGSGDLMPYFDADWLTTTKRSSGRSIGKVVNSFFPFKKTVTGTGDNEVTTYSFDSTNGNDNVYFAWNNGQPTAVKYGSGSSYAVEDGVKYFMHDGTSGKGIFPFNNASYDSGRQGNSNLDYGFGIRLDMDFRVPENGKIGGGSSSYDSSIIKFTNSLNWGSVYAYFFDDSGDVGAAWPGNAMTKYETNAYGQDNYKISIPTGAKYVIFNNNAGAQTANLNLGVEGYYLDGSTDGSGHYNGTSWGGSGSTGSQDVKFDYSGDDDLWVYITDPDTNTSQLVLDLGGSHKQASGSINFATMQATADNVNANYYDGKTGKVVKNFGFESNGNGTYKNLDPNKTYHMTVFYMERGLIESNFKVAFSMTPVIKSNELQVNKTVNVGSVNSGLSSAVTDILNNKEFTFVPNDDGTDAASFTLKNGGTKDYIDEFETGSKMTVTESKASGDVYNYDTAWEVIDLLDNNNKLASGTGLNTNQFTFANKEGLRTKETSIEVNYTNTPKYGDLSFKKLVLNADGNSFITSDKFAFEVKVDLNGGTDYQPYDLAYTLNSDTTEQTATDGKFTIGANDTVTIKGIPQGATYQITETPTSGYVPSAYTYNGSSQTFTGTVNGTIDSAASSYVFTNEQSTGTAVVNAKKTLDGNDYTGSKFSFTLSGLPGVAGDSSIVDTSSQRSITADSVNGGNITFQNNGEMLKYTKTGVYRYKLVENSIADTDYTTDTSVYLVQVTVTSDASGALIIGTPEYYKPTATVASDSEYAQFFTSANKLSSAPAFANQTKTGNVNITKEDKNGSGLGGVEFKIYRSYDKSTGTLSDPLKDSDNNDVVAVTGSDGKASFNNIPIFANDSTETDVKYQKYYLAETKNKSGYMLLAEPIEFTLPMNYNAGDVVNGVVQETSGKTYTISYTVQNDKITVPNTDGPGTYMLFIIGGAVCAFGICGLIYCKKHKRPSRRYRA